MLISRRLLMIVLLLAVPGAAAAAMETEEVVRLTKAQVGDEVIIAQMKAAGARFALTTDEIVRLKREGVSDAVIKAMIESAPPREPPPAAKAEPRPQPAAPAAEPAAASGTLVIENLDSRDYSLQVDAEHGNVFFYSASAAEWRRPLPARSSQAWPLPAGAYRLTWVGGSDSHTVTVAAGGESRAVLTRTVADGFEAVYVSLSEGGRQRGGGRLHVLADSPPPRAAAPAPAPPAAQSTVVVERHYYAAPPPRPVRAAPACGGYGYDRRRRSGGLCLLPAFSYDWKRGRNVYSLGWGPGGGLGFAWHRRLGRSGYTLSWGW